MSSITLTSDLPVDVPHHPMLAFADFEDESCDIDFAPDPQTHR